MTISQVVLASLGGLDTSIITAHGVTPW